MDVRATMLSVTVKEWTISAGQNGPGRRELMAAGWRQPSKVDKVSPGVSS
jgi:hypothetical protein